MTSAAPEPVGGKGRWIEWMRTVASRNAAGWVILFAMAGAGVGLLIWATRWGPGVSSDSVAYIVSARNLVRGIGLGIFSGSGRFRVLTHFPPLYPLSLSALDAVGLPEVAGARWLNVAIFAGFLLLPAWILARTWGPWMGAIWVGLTAASPALVTQFSRALSEPLALFLGFAGLMGLVAYTRAPSPRLWVPSAVAIGLASIARYHAIAFALTGILMFGLVNSKPGRDRWRELAGYFALALAPLLTWLTILRLEPGGEAARLGSPLPADIWNALQPMRGAFVEVVWGWTALPTTGMATTYRERAAILLAIMLSSAAATIVLYRRRTESAELRTASVGLLTTLVFGTLHVGVLTAALIATFPPPDVSERTLLPLLPAAILHAVFLWAAMGGRPRIRRLLLPLLAIGGIALLWSWIPMTAYAVGNLHAAGEGYTAAGWRRSPTLKELESVPREVPIISNEASLILFTTDHPAYEITELNEGKPLPGFPPYGSDPADRAQRAFREEGGLLVLFHTAYWHFYPIYEGDTAGRLQALVQGLVVVSRWEDADIYRYPRQGASAGPRRSDGE